jgi:hypothetical protein
MRSSIWLLAVLNLGQIQKPIEIINYKSTFISQKSYTIYNEKFNCLLRYLLSLMTIIDYHILVLNYSTMFITFSSTKNLASLLMFGLSK